MVNTGSNMPMKMMPMNPAIKNSISGSAKATAVFRLPVQIHLGDGGDADQFGVELAAFLGHGNHFQNRAGNKILALRQALAEPAALLHALDGLGDGIHENLVADGFARDVQALHQRHARAEQRARASGKNAPSQIAPTSGPTSGARNTIPSQTRLPFSEANQVRTRNTDRHQTRRDKQSVGTHHMADADDDLRDQRQRTVNAGENRSGISG